MIRRLALVAAVALVAAQQAAAHAVPLGSSPADGARLARAPAAVTVTFDGSIRPTSRIAAVDARGRSVAAGRPRVGSGHRLVIPLRPGLGRGDYTARWSVVSDDGHEEEGLVVFAVGAGSAPPVAALTVRGAVAWQRIVMRTLFLLGALGAAGSACFAGLVLRPLGLEADLVRREAGLLFTFFLLAFCGADALAHTTGAAGTRFDQAVTVAAVAAGIGAAAAALMPLDRRLSAVAALAAAVVLVCPAVAGHAFDADQPLPIAPIADLLHLAGAAVWAGGTVSLLAVLGRISAQSRRAAVVRFGTIAGTAVGLLAVAGVTRAVTELDSVSQLWSTGYGRVLLVKSALLAAAAALAWVNRSALADGLSRGRRALVLEVAALAAILVAVGVLTDLRPGRRASPGPARTGRGLLGVRPVGGLDRALTAGARSPLDGLEEAGSVLERRQSGHGIAS